MMRAYLVVVALRVGFAVVSGHKAAQIRPARNERALLSVPATAFPLTGREAAGYASWERITRSMGGDWRGSGENDDCGVVPR